ncbi:RelA/SpoT domain-containing protein [Sinorhizobium medicae]|uniref:RelA/SpoT domain-containing protein n=1 Tax=Sinorhizobium medicae TaxID=110321 RepID=UPI000FDA699E|nr:RelA/SpoT domain-containing protein [Sinorhizobium medicae]RVJ27064.1 hypothetical protein CN179_20685 [Sinorhizobium medicae]
MAQYPQLKFSMKAVRRSGERLAEKLIVVDEESYQDAQNIFQIANSWRDSHFLPMRSVYLSVRFRMLRGGISGDMAARPKRMASIRRKLRETSTKLDQMQDIAGCRAIINDIAGVRELTARIREKVPHSFRQEWPYIDAPKADGYRSHHLVFDFCPRKKDQEPYQGRRIELQIRTRLQHSWATAVEAVGLFNGQDLKHHKGSEEWLRLFQLVSAEFAHVEGCPVGPDVPCRSERIAEIKDLNHRLGAVGVLENIRTATHYAETFVYDRGKYFLIVYKADHTVEVENYDDSIQVTARLAKIERDIEGGSTNAKAVVVEVNKVENLVRTYPNYFGDVSLFVRNLRRITKGEDAQEYSLSPQQVVRPRPHERPDPSLLIRRYRGWDL